MPETQDPQKSVSEPFIRLLQPPQLYGVFAIAMLGIASFLFFGAYAASQNSKSSQSASAAASLNAFADIKLQAKAAFVVDISTGNILYQLNPDIQLPLASITKVPLALAVSEVLDSEDSIIIPYDTAPTTGGEKLSAGQSWRVQDVINFTLIASSNEGAEILADAAGKQLREKYADAPRDGSARDVTLWRMNQLALEQNFAGMYFLNVSGLDESETQSGAFGTARSVAALMAYAASSSPGVFAGTARDGLLMSDEAGNTTTAINTNEALGSITGLMMGKTGITDLAGGNLAVVFDIGISNPVVVVVLGSTRDGRFSDVKQLTAAAREAITAPAVTE